MGKLALSKQWANWALMANVDADADVATVS
jgi:hypothetical protein